MNDILEKRYYDPQTISNKFAVGERIEWVAREWNDRQGKHHLCFEKGVLLHIRPRIVIIAIECPDGNREYWRIERFYLSRFIRDEQLKQAVDTWEGEGRKQRRSRKSPTPPDRPYSIYKLTDPYDGTVHYVGATNNAKRRFKQHLKMDDLNFKKNAWIQALLSQGLLPIMEVIEEGIHGKETAEARETYWIAYHLALGQPLTNLTKTGDYKDRDVWQ